MRRAILSRLLQAALASASGTAAATIIQDDAAFEAALKAKAPAAATAAARRGSYVMLGMREKPGALPGTVPARWRPLRALPADLAPLQADVAEGRLDPAALIAQIAGPLPIPPGASPAGCGRDLTTVTYTLGENLSPAYDALIAQGTRGELADVLDRAALDAQPIRARLHTFLLSRGYRLLRRAGTYAAYRNDAARLHIDVYDTSASLQHLCDPERATINLPTGPVMMITLERE